MAKNTIIKTLVKDAKKLLPIKVTEAEHKKMQALADKWAGGNLSGWIRHAALNYEPKKTDF